MARQTDNLSLDVWDQGSDVFSGNQFADNFEKIDEAILIAKQVEIVATVPSTDNFAGRLVMLSADDSGFIAWTLLRYDGNNWNVVGGIEIHGTFPVSGNFAGRCVLLTAISGVFPAFTLFIYNGSAWRPVDTIAVQKNGTTVGTRQILNLVGGTNIELEMDDDSDDGSVNIDIGASTPTAALTVQKNGTTVGSKSRVEFITGNNIALSVTDDAVEDDINVQFASQPSGPAPVDPLLNVVYWNPPTIFDVTSTTRVTIPATTGITVPKINPTNLKFNFTVPSSGKVYVRLTGTKGISGIDSSQFSNWTIAWCLVEGNTPVTGSIVGVGSLESVRSSVDMVITGLPAGATKTWYWGHAVLRLVTQTASPVAHFFVGGRGDIEGDVAGPAIMEIWSV